MARLSSTPAGTTNRARTSGYRRLETGPGRAHSGSSTDGIVTAKIEMIDPCPAT